ncbi:MAG: hypothetical protein JSS81_12005 [Acidobacteria bacterium]|nr:hypothetical protein [Acidobacteriota bacterium]
MKPIIYSFGGLLVGLAACFVWFSAGTTGSAQKAVRSQWEYSAITTAYSFTPTRDKLNKIYGMAQICYLQATGCRYQEVKHEFDYGLYLQDRALLESFQARRDAGLKASEIAFQKAVSQLGADGWEIVSDPELKFDFVDIDEYNKYEDKSVLFSRENTKAVYFKRLKVQ